MGTMNIQSIIILIVVLALFGYISFRMLTQKKTKSCEGCSLISFCPKKSKD